MSYKQSQFLKDYYQFNLGILKSLIQSDSGIINNFNFNLEHIYSSYSTEYWIHNLKYRLL